MVALRSSPFFKGADPVLARFLGLVHGFIGPGNQLLLVSAFFRYRHPGSLTVE